MAKAFDPALLEPERYTYERTITTRFADVDKNGHINNVALAAAFEDARVRFGMELALRGDGSDRPMVAAVYIDYLAQAHYPKPLCVKVGILSLGRSSWAVAELALQEGKPCALCRATLVNTDGVRARPLSEDVRATLERLRLRLP
jgi:acyl-CoA thioester hydrolase